MMLGLPGIGARSRRDTAELLYALVATGVIVAAVWATIEAGWWHQRNWEKGGALNFALTLAVLVPPLAFAPLRALPALALVGAVMIASLSSLAALAGCAALLSCAYVAGREFQLRVGAARAETATGAMDLLLALALGLALVALAVNAAVFLPFNGRPLYLAAAIGTILLGRRHFREALAQVKRYVLAPPVERNWLASLPRRLLILLVWLHLLVTAFPEMGSDALAMHLAIPHILEEEGRWTFDVTRYIWAVMPMNADWLYTAAYFLGGEGAARLFNTATLLLTGAVLLAWTGERLGAAVAVVSALFWLSLPLSFLESASAFIELPLTFLCTATLVAAERAVRDGHPGHWLTAAALFGSAAATKLVALLLLPGLMLIAASYFVVLRRDPAAAWWRQGTASRLLRTLGLALLVALLFAAPPYVNAWVRTGNPVFPFFNVVFRSPHFETAMSFTNPAFVHPIGWASFVELWLHSSRFLESAADGALGSGLIVLLPLAALAALVRRDAVVLVLLAVAATFCLLVFREQVYLRYIVPVLPLLCVGAAYGLAQIRPAPVAAAAGAVILAVHVARLPSAHRPLVTFPVQTIFLEETRGRFLLENAPEQVAAVALRSLVQGSYGRAALLDVDPAMARAPAGTVSDVWHSYPVWKAAQTGGAEGLLGALVARGVEYIVLPKHSDAARLQRLLEVSTQVAGVGRLEIRRIDMERLPLRQALADPDFRQAQEHWAVAAERVDTEGRGVWVTADSPATQRIELNGARMVLVENRFHCPQPTSVRSQVNWHAADGRMLSTTIEVAPCSGDVVLRRRVDPPPGAASAGVYASAHAKEPVLAVRASAQVPALAGPM